MADKGGGSRQTQRVAGCDVDLADGFRQTVDEGLKQSLVAKHDGSSSSCRDALWREPLADVSGLDVFGRCTDVGHLLWGLLVGVLIEDGLASFLQSMEKGLFDLLEQVETDEGIGVITELDGLVFGYLSVEGSLIAELLTGELFVEGVVYIADVTPETEETLFEFTVVIVGEVAEEAADDLPLFVCKIGEIIEFMDVAQIGKHLVGRAHVLVKVVEVGEQQLPPAVEVIERFIDTRTLGEAFVQFTDE